MNKNEQNEQADRGWKTIKYVWICISSFSLCSPFYYWFSLALYHEQLMMIHHKFFKYLRERRGPYNSFFQFSERSSQRKKTTTLWQCAQTQHPWKASSPSLALVTVLEAFGAPRLVTGRHWETVDTAGPRPAPPPPPSLKAFVKTVRASSSHSAVRCKTSWKWAREKRNVTQIHILLFDTAWQPPMQKGIVLS